MGTWDTSIKGNDTTLDIYSYFYERYNNGEDPIVISNIIKEEYSDYFTEFDDKNNALFGFALAQWETKCLENNILKEVKKVIDSNDDLKFWGNDKKIISKRKSVLNKFLTQISSERLKPKRRRKAKFEHKSVDIIKTVSPDKLKEFVISDEYVNGKYIHTLGMMTWYSGSGSGILSYNKPNANIMASWKKGNNLHVVFKDDLVFSKKETTFYLCGDQGKIEYIRE